MNFSKWFSRKVAQPPSEEVAQMHGLCERISRALHAAGYRVPALSLVPRPYPKEYAARKEALTIFADLIMAADVRNSKDLMWRYFGKMRYAPCSDVLGRIEDDDILEVFDMNGDQIFRNLNYFDVVSMSVEDLMSVNWKRDFKRGTKVTFQLIEMSFRFATGIFTQTMDCAKVPVHIIQELIAKRNVIELNLKFISPLKQNGKCVAILVASRARILKQAQ